MPRKTGSLTYQIKKNLDSKLAIGESKFQAKKVALILITFTVGTPIKVI